MTGATGATRRRSTSRGPAHQRATSRRPTRRRAAALGLLVPLLVSALVASCSSDDDGAAAPDRPNILFIVTDDMTVDDLAAMPHVRDWLGDAGTSFTRAYVSVSLCCPARTTMLRGQYAHNTGVLSNEGTNGGFPVAHRLGLERSTVATWLEGAGYRTGLIGKYLNLYPEGAGPTYVPPGWDEWSSPVLGNSGAGFDFTLNENGRLVPYGRQPDDFASQVFVDRTARFVTDAAEAGEPFFAWLAVDAPHDPGGARPDDAAAVAELTAPRTASFDQDDVSAAPAWVADLPHLTAGQEREIDDRYRHRQASLRSLDRELARLEQVLDDNGQLDDTYVVFTSDNGFHLGQHRLKAGKQSAFEEDIAVPLLVSGPGVPRGETSDALVADLDFAPTFADLAGADAPDFVDGRSLVDLWHDPGGPGPDRHAVLLEHWPPAFSAPSAGGTEQPGSQPVLDPEARGEGPAPPEFQGVRTARYTYVEYVTGEVELYDNTTDPDQLHNLADTAPAALLADLATLVADLGDCAGQACRDAEATVVP